MIVERHRRRRPLDHRARPLRSTNGHGLPSDFSAPVVTRLTEDLHHGSSRLQAAPRPDEWMARLAAIPLLHQPGDGFTYNTAYDILGVLIARVSGQPFSHYVNIRILQPLGMTNTGFCFPAGSSDRVTTSYRRGDDGTIAIVLTQTALGGPAGARIMETFWTAAATALGHST
jgi:CubicO group peptidase (beta-lactamase class C family)